MVVGLGAAHGRITCFPVAIIVGDDLCNSLGGGSEGQDESDEQYREA